MTAIVRYAIYHLPEGALGAWGESWLGWRMHDGRPLPRPEVEGLPRPVEALTAAATVYGLHATIKPPFRLAPGTTEAELEAALATFAAATAPAAAAGLRLASLDGFLALVPEGEAGGIDRIAAGAVAAFDRFRAPPPPEETARRRAAGLTPRQEALLARWGYPYVMEEFRYHITLTGRLAPAEAAATAAALAPHLAPLLPRPFRLDRLALVGQRAEGGFVRIAHHALSG